MRLIDADAIEYDFSIKAYGDNQVIVTSLLADKDTIDAMPTVEPKKGKWILPNDCAALYLDEWICSNCTHLISHKHNFCPNCGADMRGDSDE